MTLPRHLRQYGTVTLVSGSADADVADGADLTAAIEVVSYPELRRNIIDLPLRYGDFPLAGRMASAETTLQVRSIYAGLMARIGSEQEWSIVEPLFSPRQPVASRSRDLTIAFTGFLIGHDLSDLNFRQDEIRTATLTYRILRYTESVENVAQPRRDYDWIAQTFHEDGVDIFTGAAVTP